MYFCSSYHENFSVKNDFNLFFNSNIDSSVVHYEGEAFISIKKIWLIQKANF